MEWNDTGARCFAAEALEPRRMMAFPLGGDFQVNTIADTSDTEVAIASDDVGNYVVSWTLQDELLGDGRQKHPSDIYVRLYGADGTAESEPFQVSGAASTRARSSSVAMDAGGDFVVVWTTGDEAGVLGPIYGRLYRADGVARGNEFRISDDRPGNFFPSVAMDPAGNFVVVWHFPATDGMNEVFARRFDSSGTPLPAPFKVNASSGVDKAFADVAVDASGDFGITWIATEVIAEELIVRRILVQRFEADGDLDGDIQQVTSEFAVNWPRIGMDASGDFVVGWTNHIIEGVFARRYSHDGTEAGLPFRVDSGVGAVGPQHSVAMSSDGRFAVTWSTIDNPSQRSSGVYFKQFTPTGDPDGAEVWVDSWESARALEPVVALSGGGDTIVAWERDRQVSRGVRDEDVHTQRFGTPAVVDGKLVIHGGPRSDGVAIQIAGDDLLVNVNGTIGTYDVEEVSRLEVYAHDGNDRVRIGAGVVGAYVLGGNGNDTLIGGDGNDSLVGASGKDSIDGGGGDDRVAGGKHGDILRGGSGNDRMYGDEAGDSIDGGLDRDRAYGGDGNDTILGSNQNDTIYGEAGDDNIDGGNHHDRIDGGTGSDTVFGGRGNDVIWAEDGVIDLVDGGLDQDTAFLDVIDTATLVEELL